MTSLIQHLVAPQRALRRYRRRRRLLQQVRHVTQPRIVIGAAGLAAEDWIATEIDQLDLLKPDAWRDFFAEGSLEAILAEHVWEHLTVDEGRVAAQTCYRFLSPGGRLRVAVPDGLHPDPGYIQHVRPQGSGPGASDHKVLYTYPSLQSVFAQAGFQVRLLEYFDEQANFRRQPWTPRDGLILRSERFDERNADRPLQYTSIILDAVKPQAA